MDTAVPVTPLDQVLEVKEILRRNDNDDGMYDMPEHHEMDYEDIFGEPEVYKTKGLGRFIHEGLTKVFGGIFNYVQSTIYYVLVMLTGIFLAFFYGLSCGVFVYFINWFVNPAIKGYYMMVRLSAAFYRPFVRVGLDPFFQSVSLMFGSIRGVFGLTLPKNTTITVPTQQQGEKRLEIVNM